MPELVYSIAARLRQWVGNRRHPQRCRLSIPCSVSIFVPSNVTVGAQYTNPLMGHTRDASATGLALIMPAIRIGGRYLTGEGRLLRVELELPTGKIEAYAVPTRYERLEDNDVEIGYLIGARITKMSDGDRKQFIECLRSS
jgi:PilZ domain-containing protein